MMLNQSTYVQSSWHIQINHHKTLQWILLLVILRTCDAFWIAMSLKEPLLFLQQSSCSRNTPKPPRTCMVLHLSGSLSLNIWSPVTYISYISSVHSRLAVPLHTSGFLESWILLGSFHIMLGSSKNWIQILPLLCSEPWTGFPSFKG